MNAPHGLKVDTVVQIARVLASFPQVERALLFGSRAKGTQKRGSDIDLALVGSALDWRVLGRIEDALDDLLLPYQFSLIICGQKTDPALAAHIRRVGIPFFERDSPAAEVLK